jgi:hypothetical protein
MKLFLKSILLCICIALTACAASPAKRFPDFAENAKSITSVDVVIDILIKSDIEGAEIGINKEKHDLALSQAKETIEKALAKRGYDTNIAFAGYGLTFSSKGEETYVFSKDGKSTGVPFNGPLPPKENTQWGEQNTRDFMTNLLQSAAGFNATPGKSQHAPYVFSKSQIPSHIDELPSNVLIFIQVEVEEVGMGKTIGSALLTGVLSAALTGGLYVYSSAPVSGSVAQVAVMDVESGAVLWHNSIRGGNTDYIQSSLEKSLKPFPTTNGVVLYPTTDVPDQDFANGYDF